MPGEVEKCFVNAFLQFLRTQIANQYFSSDMIESLEVAIQCLEAAYELEDGPGEVTDGAASSSPYTRDSLAGAANIDLFDLFQTACFDKDPSKLQEAEEVKNDGNRLMKEGKFMEALYQYNRAIRLDPTNPIFYCNRAAAYTKLNEFTKAVTDCKMSLSYNPNYSKAYGRMGVAYSNLQKYDEARDAYKKAIELEPNNQDYQNNLRLLENKQRDVNALEMTKSIFQNLPNNDDFKKLITDLMADPFIANSTRQLINDYPNLIPNFRQQLSDFSNQTQQTQQQHLPQSSNATVGGEQNVAGSSRDFDDDNAPSTSVSKCTATHGPPPSDGRGDEGSA